MIWLGLGLALWCGLHLMPSLAPDMRASLIERLGKGRYMMVFAIGIIVSIALMVLGWRMSDPVDIYLPSSWAPQVGIVLVLIAFILFALSSSKTNVKRFLRHPQLTGMAVWAAGHLLANGDSRSVVLFGVLGVWAIIEIVLINRREGPWVRPDPVPAMAEVKPVVIGLIVFSILLIAHPYLFGVSPLSSL